MNNYSRQEISVGAFVVLGALALAYLSLKLGEVGFATGSSTTVSARFSSVGSLKVGDPVKIAGVTVGGVESVRLVNFEAEAIFTITEPVALPDDSIASIKSAGLLGDAYVSLSPGASDKDLAPGGRILRTEPAVSMTDLLAKYAFGSPTEESPAPSQAADDLELFGVGSVKASATTSASATGTAAPTPAPSPTSSPKKSVFKDPLE